MTCKLVMITNSMLKEYDKSKEKIRDPNKKYIWCN